MVQARAPPPCLYSDWVVGGWGLGSSASIGMNFSLLFFDDDVVQGMGEFVPSVYLKFGYVVSCVFFQESKSF